MNQKFYIATKDIIIEKPDRAPVWVANRGDKIKWEVAVNLGLVKGEPKVEDKAVASPRGARKK